MANNKKRTLCDFKCPVYQSCRNYVEGFDKTKTIHWGAMPYRNGKCIGFEQLTEDDIIDFVNRILTPFNN